MSPPLRPGMPWARTAVCWAAAALVCAALLVGQGLVATVEAQAALVDYDLDDDGLIDVRNAAQLNAIRWDLNGDGAPDSATDAADYASAFPDAVTSPRMGCSPSCSGYELVASVNLSAAGNPTMGWEPIGTTSDKFDTTFDGRSLTLSNLTISRDGTNYVGLFGRTGTSSVIRNVTLARVDVTGEDWTGGLAGRNEGSISGVSVAGSVSGNNHVGGLVGANSGPISNSHVSKSGGMGTVQGLGAVGGLVGTNLKRSGANAITGSSASVDVTGTGNTIGGLVGNNLAAPITDSHASGNVTGVNWTGGLIGSNYDEDVWNSTRVGRNAIRWSTASGDVAGGEVVGGLAGFNNGPISDSDALGSTVTGSDFTGGLVGSNNNGGVGAHSITRSTASANVTATVGQRVGGLAGYSDAAIRDSHASGDVVGDGTFGGLVGLSYADITDSSATGDVGDSTSSGAHVGGLVGQSKSGTISGSVASGRVRSTGSTVGGLVGRSEGSIIEAAASGAVSGATSVGGLVGFQRNTGSIDSSRATGSVTGMLDGAGGLVGWSEGEIRGSEATGAVSGVNRVGGLVGDLVSGLPDGDPVAARIVASFASGSVTGTGVGTGGLVGCARSASAFNAHPGAVLNSYASGAVSGNAATTGGLVGVGESAYRSGTVVRAGARFISDYWDTESSGQSAGIGSRTVDCGGNERRNQIETAAHGVVGRTTSALQTPTGYTGIFATWSIDEDDGDTTVTAGNHPWDFGGSSDYPSLRSTTRPPSFSTATLTRTVAEDAAPGASVGSAVTATDSDGDTLTYSIVGAAGRAFSIDGDTGQIKVAAVLDEERRDTHTVTVQASDGKLVAFKVVEVTVTGVNEPPSFTTATATRSVAENASLGAPIGRPVAATDPDTSLLTYTLEGPDAAHFSISSSSGQLARSAALDHEYRDSYAVTVKASDGSHSALIDVTVTVTDADDAGAIRWSSSQPQAGTALTATLVDPDPSVSGASWQWILDGTPIDGATSASYTPVAADAGKTLSARVTYGDAFGTGKEVTLALGQAVRAAPTGTNAAPTFAPGTVTRTVAENSDAGTDVGLPVTATDTDTADVLTYSLSGADAASFDIDSGTGQLTTRATLDAETKATHSVTVVARDPSNASASRPVTITVTGVDEAPAVSGSREVDFAEGGTTTVATYTARDPESTSTTITWSLAGADASSFTIAAGALSFAAAPDYESPADTGRDNVYHVTVEASDASTVPNTGSLHVAVTVTDTDETPTVSGPTTATFAENTYGLVAAFTVDDPENGTITWSLAGSDSSDFEISTNGRLRRASRTPRDYESSTGSSGNTYSVTVRASDGTNTGSQALTVTVTDVDEQPVLSGPANKDYDENTTGSIGTYRNTDPEGATTAWQDLTGPDAAMFELVDNVLSFRTSATFTSPDFEDPMDADSDNVYEVTLQASDSTTPTPHTGRRDVFVTIVNIDEDGVVTLDSLQPRVDVPLTATLTDDDGQISNVAWRWQRDGAFIHSSRGSMATYTPTRGSLGNPNIPSDLGTLLTATVTYTDAHGDNKTARVTAANRVATELPGSRPPLFPTTETGQRSVAENTPAGRAIGAPVAATDEDVTDPNVIDVLTYSLSGAGAASFAIRDATGQLRTEEPLDFEQQSTYSVTVTARDSTGLEATQDVVVTVTDVNEPPVLTAGQAQINYAENATETAGTYAATDGDGAAITWSLAGTDSAAFTITGGELRFVDPPDFEQQRTYRVTVRASDGTFGDPGVLTDSVNVVINISDVNEPPEFTAGEEIVMYPENATRPVETYRATDPERNPVTWSLPDSDSDTFTLTGGVLRFKAPPNYEEESIFNLTVEASDGTPGEPGTLTTEFRVAVVVENVAEPGLITLSSLQPQVGTPLVASLADEDNVAGAIAWQWYGGSDEIAGAVSDGYTPVDADIGNRLRVTATYDDGAALDETAGAASAHPVRARPQSNAAPEFPSSETGARDVGQDTAAGEAFGAPVAATDSDGDVLTYSLDATGDRAAFTVDRATGQLRTSGAIARPLGETYFVRVRATDPSGEAATQGVTITVTEEASPPVSSPVIGPPGPIVIPGGGGDEVPTGPEPSEADFEWTVEHDIEALDSGHRAATGAWSDGEAAWVLDNPDGAGDAVYAYDLGSGERDPEREFALAETNRAPRGIWSDTETAWVSDSGRERLFAYDLDSGERDPERELELAPRNDDARGIWSDGETMWVLDDRRNAVFAYGLANG